MTVSDPTWFVFDLNANNGVRAVLAQLARVNNTAFPDSFVDVEMRLLDQVGAARRLDETGHVSAAYEINIPWGVIFDGYDNFDYAEQVGVAITTTSTDRMTELIMQAIAERAGGWAYIVTVTEITTVGVKSPEGEQKSFQYDPPKVDTAVASNVVRVQVPSNTAIALVALAATAWR